MADSYDTCSDNVRVTKQLLESVGFSINFAKSMLKMEHLGFVLDSQTMTVAVTKDKQDKLIYKCHFGTQVAYDQISGRAYRHYCFIFQWGRSMGRYIFKHWNLRKAKL